MLIILAFLRPIRMMFAKVTAAETWKNAALGETIFGIKTVKSLALEPQRKALWDERVAEVGKWRLAVGQARRTGRRPWSRRSSASCGSGR